MRYKPKILNFFPNSELIFESRADKYFSFQRLAHFSLFCESVSSRDYFQIPYYFQIL